LLGRIRTVNDSDLHIDNRLPDEEDEIVDQKLPDDLHLRTWVDSESSFAKTVTEFGEVGNSGPAQNERHYPGQNQQEWSSDNNNLICRTESVILVDRFNFQYWPDPSMVRSGDAAIVGSAVEGQGDAPDHPDDRKDDGPNCLQRTALKTLSWNVNLYI